MPISPADQIAQSAAFAAWVGAGASTFASIVALSVAVWGARREESRRRRLISDQEAAFAYGMVAALEMIKPLIVDARARPDACVARRRFVDAVTHAIMMADAALAIQVFDMQMLRDGYLARGALLGLSGVPDQSSEADVAHTSILAALEPVLDGLLDADDRFFARLPTITEVQGIQGRTPVARRTA